VARGAGRRESARNREALRRWAVCARALGSEDSGSRQSHFWRFSQSDSMSRRILRSRPGPTSRPLWTGTVVRRPSGCSNCQSPLGLPEQAKAHALQHTHELAGFDHGNAPRRHAATSIRLTPMISAWRGISAPRAFRSARQSVITSRMFLMVSS